MAITVADLEGDPHALLAELRRREPVAWIPALNGWLVTRRDLALAVMRAPERFTVDDPRFSTARVVGPSMLSLDGAEHDRHRGPFARPFRRDEVRERLARRVTEEAGRLVAAIEPRGRAEVREEVAGPLAAAAMAEALGIREAGTDEVLGWYRAIVASVQEITAGAEPPESGRGAFAALDRAIAQTVRAQPDSSLLAEAAATGALAEPEVVSNAAVLLFGGIETTEGMIANALLHLLAHPGELALARAEGLENAVEESLRLEPAAALVDRYATADLELGGADIRPGDLVSISITAANRDPAEFPDPDRFDVRRPNARRHAAFAAGPHVCVGMHLARLEAHTALERLLALPGLRLDPDAPAPAARGLVFRKPPALKVVWG